MCGSDAPASLTIAFNQPIGNWGTASVTDMSLSVRT
jgi:surface protein